eukprot:scaffold418_cov386-Prasinococcus_capsulatus_cf.AAC.21
MVHESLAIVLPLILLLAVCYNDRLGSAEHVGQQSSVQGQVLHWHHNRSAKPWVHWFGRAVPTAEVAIRGHGGPFAASTSHLQELNQLLAKLGRVFQIPEGGHLRTLRHSAVPQRTAPTSTIRGTRHIPAAGHRTSSLERKEDHQGTEGRLLRRIGTWSLLSYPAPRQRGMARPWDG